MGYTTGRQRRRSTKRPRDDGIAARAPDRTARRLAGRAGATAFGAPLVATKLTPPTLPRGHRERARLSERLDAALDEAVRLTLISAPPGYGKSIAVAGWLAARRLDCAWLSVDAADNDPARFVHYLVAALKKVRRDAGDATLGLVATGATATVDLLGPTIVGEVAASEDPFVLVLDDYQAITAGPIHELIRFLVRNAPPFVHLILVTRHDPPLPLARLRAHARLVELRADDLRHTGDEAAAFLEDVMGVALPSELAARVVDRTEGWAAALQLAALALRDRPDAPEQIEAIASSRRAVYGYLADEVLAGLDEELRAFLVHTSVAGRFTAELAAELTGRDSRGSARPRGAGQPIPVARCPGRPLVPLPPALRRIPSHPARRPRGAGAPRARGRLLRAGRPGAGGDRARACRGRSTGRPASSSVKPATPSNRAACSASSAGSMPFPRSGSRRVPSRLAPRLGAPVHGSGRCRDGVRCE